ncbi:hypothetical protein [Dyella mobilis]|uniref:Uncharacterized protein n=1 Tax=Dyella mobilis TaxID=1849582 RepID=A0ABS2KCR8_9GAMM|nr:hypothetical protein [Dyella mobilis]MBM7128620.1 hypothetical protein [Dyella mobilis]GLQ99476.1 hypothetical protein GCM10007863_38960 [Dyella mobilis]
MMTLRELRKMRHLWNSPAQQDDRKLVAFLSSRPYTPLYDALRTTLTVIGCMPSQSSVAHVD